MKKGPIYLLIMMLLGVFFVACDKDDADTLTFDKNNVEVYIEETITVKVSGGVAPYTAKPANETMVKVTVSGSEITIEGLEEGSTAVTVTDANGIEGTLPVKVSEDPYENEKEDATVRVIWGGEFKKVQGEDAGRYELTKAEDKTVIFTWSNEAEDETEVDSFVLTFKDTNDLIGEEVEVETASTRDSPIVYGTLVVTENGESTDYDVLSLRLVQAAPAEEGVANTYWIAITAGGKSGLVVAPLTEETVE